MANRWTFGAVGDVYVNRKDPPTAFDYSGDVLKSVDLLFGNCEGSYTDHPSPSPGAGWAVTSRISNIAPLAPAGFHVMACANNHILDGGYDGLADTLDALGQSGIHTLGAGRTNIDARKPVIVERGGVKIGFLARSSVHPPAYAARSRTPGVAAIRVHSNYYVKDGDPYAYVEPGSPPQVWTAPWQEDVESLQDDIRKLKQTADVVIVSCHWGTARVPVELKDYERDLAKKAIEAGADIVLGHHHHFLRGVEFYRGKPIFYGLGHFVFDTDTDSLWSKQEVEELQSMGQYAIFPREGYPLLPFHPDGRMTMMASFEFDGKTLEKVGIFPFIISPANCAVPATGENGGFELVHRYLQDITTQVGDVTEYIATSDFFIGGGLGIEVRGPVS